MSRGKRVSVSFPLSVTRIVSLTSMPQPSIHMPRMDGWGIEVSETILVTESGNETLTRFPRDIHVKS